MEKSGEIGELKTQVTFKIEWNNVKICKYIADFTYFEGDSFVVEDFKSQFTAKLPVYRIKKKLMLACHGIEIRETGYTPKKKAAKKK